jgi:hypothetical protein
MSMLPEKTEPPRDEEPFPNPFAEPRAEALQWDVSVLWPDATPPCADPTVLRPTLPGITMQG